MAPDILTIYIPASQEYSFVSSTVARDVIIHQGNAELFMPKGVNIQKYIKAGMVNIPPVKSDKQE